MFRKELKALSARYGLLLSGDIAHGYLYQCRVSLTHHSRFIRLGVYLGALDAAPDGVTPRLHANAETIRQRIIAANGDGNAFSLALPNAVSAALNGSVLHVDFLRGGVAGLDAFIAQMLPQLAPMTAPLQCIHCGGLTGGQGVPVRIAPDAVVPMHPQCRAQCDQLYRARRRQEGRSPQRRRGWIGAGIGAALALIAWLLCFDNIWLGIMLLAITLALTLGGYRLLGGSAAGMALPVGVCSCLAILLGASGHEALALHRQYKAFGSVVHGMMKELTYLRMQLLDGPLLWQIPALLAAAGLCIACMHRLICRRAQQSSCRPKSLSGQA